MPSAITSLTFARVMGGNENLTVEDFMPEFDRPIQTWENQLAMIEALHTEIGGRTRGPRADG